MWKVRKMPSVANLSVMKGLCLIVLALVVIPSVSLSPAISAYLTNVDRLRLQNVFDEAWSTEDVAAIQYAVLGYKLLENPIPNQAKICQIVSKTLNSGTKSVENLHYAAAAWKGLASCPGVQIKDADVAFVFTEATANEGSAIADLYHAVLGLNTLGKPIPNAAKIATQVNALLKKDDSVLSLAQTFHLAAALGSNGKFAVDRIEDAIVQADEVDGKFLQFEAGLSVTALVVSGAYRVAEASSKNAPMTPEQMAKFSSYFMNRLTVQTPKGAFSLLDVVNVLTTNKFHLPVAVTLHGSSAVHSGQPSIAVRVCDLLGKPISTSPLTVTAESITRTGDNVVVLSKKKFNALPDDKTVHALNMFEDKLGPGLYSVAIKVDLTKADPRVATSVVATLPAKVMCKVAVKGLEIGTADADQTTQPKLHKVNAGEKLSTVLEADTQQKLVMHFQLINEETKAPLTVHQAFVLLENEATKQTTTFVAEPDAKSYKFDVDVGSIDKNFAGESGAYKTTLVIGDAVVVNPVLWHVANIKLTFPSSPEKQAALAAKAQCPFKPKPEIKHQFREPEKRPPSVVSNLFTILVCIPLLLLVILWAQLRIKLSNFTLSAMGFHLSLAAIFGLFTLFWLKLNMFTTCKWLLGIGALTFLTGNKMLAEIAKRRKQV